MKNVLRHGREKKYLYPTVAMCVETIRYLPIFILPYDLKVWLAKANLTFACCLVVDRHNYGILGFLRTLSHIFSCHTHFIHKLAVHKLAGP